MKESPKHTDEIAVLSISPGEGKIIEFRKEKFGVYRDTDSNYHIVSAVCTHLQCSVNWNNDEKSWDCPCHGSRYFIDSTNFYGPAPRPMDWIDVQVAPDDHLVVDRGKLVVVRQPGDNSAPQWRLLLDSKKSNGKTLGV